MGKLLLFLILCLTLTFMSFSLMDPFLGKKNVSKSGEATNPRIRASERRYDISDKMKLDALANDLTKRKQKSLDILGSKG